MPALEIVLSILGGAAVVLSGYLVNGRLQRHLQKATTNYHVKLEAYREVNRAAIGLINALVGLRNAFAIRRGNTLTEDDISDLSWQMGVARESEALLETDVIDRMSEDLNRASLQQSEQLQERAAAARTELLNVYSRAFAHQRDTIELQLAQANLVSQSKSVNAALGRFEERVVQHSEYSTAHAGAGSPTMEELGIGIEELMNTWRLLTEAMRDELHEAL